jgi:hypothetical protein
MANYSAAEGVGPIARKMLQAPHHPHLLSSGLRQASVTNNSVMLWRIFFTTTNLAQRRYPGATFEK